MILHIVLLKDEMNSPNLNLWLLEKLHSFYELFLLILQNWTKYYQYLYCFVDYSNLFLRLVLYYHPIHIDLMLIWEMCRKVKVNIICPISLLSKVKNAETYVSKPLYMSVLSEHTYSWDCNTLIQMDERGK